MGLLNPDNERRGKQKREIMSSWKVHSGVHCHFVTATITEWRFVFTEIPYFEIITSALRLCMAEKNLRLHAYVIMPNHVHYITSTNNRKCLSDVMRDLNRFTSVEISKMLGIEQRRELLNTFKHAAKLENRGNTHKVWQDGFHPIAIETEDFFLEKLNYIHDNPVRKGFVEKPEHWLYSSARNYILEDPSILPVECLV